MIDKNIAATKGYQLNARAQMQRMLAQDNPELVNLLGLPANPPAHG